MKAILVAALLWAGSAFGNTILEPIIAHDMSVAYAINSSGFVVGADSKCVMLGCDGTGGGSFFVDTLAALWLPTSAPSAPAIYIRHPWAMQNSFALNINDDREVLLYTGATVGVCPIANCNYAVAFIGLNGAVLGPITPILGPGGWDKPKMYNATQVVENVGNCTDWPRVYPCQAVIISRVPEPSTFALFALGFIVIGWNKYGLHTRTA